MIFASRVEGAFDYSTSSNQATAVTSCFRVMEPNPLKELSYLAHVIDKGHEPADD